METPVPTTEDHRPRYSDDNIKQALEFIKKPYGGEPLLNSFQSILDGNINQDTKIIKFNYSPLDSTFFGFLTHWFIQIDNQEWHPGNKENVLFVPVSDRSLYQTQEIVEMCNYCAYNFFFEKMRADSAFNMYYRNCEIILNRYMETTLMYIMLFFLILFVTTWYLIWVVLFVIFYTLIVYINHDTCETTWRQCPHIQHPINNKIYTI